MTCPAVRRSMMYLSVPPAAGDLTGSSLGGSKGRSAERHTEIEERLLALHVEVHRALGDAKRLRDVIHARPPEPLVDEESRTPPRRIRLEVGHGRALAMCKDEGRSVTRWQRLSRSSRPPSRPCAISCHGSRIRTGRRWPRRWRRRSRSTTSAASSASRTRATSGRSSIVTIAWSCGCTAGVRGSRLRCTATARRPAPSRSCAAPPPRRCWATATGSGRRAASSWRTPPACTR